MIRTTTLMSMLLGVVLTVVLFALEFQVRELEDELAVLDRSIVAESQAIHVLKAEWSYLNDPWRLRRLAERFLKLTPVRPEQLSSLADLPRRRPVGAGGRAGGPAKTTALADRGERR
jgi:hypothetical protein